MGMNEIRWTKSFAQPRINYQRSLDSPDTPGEYLKLLTKYLQLAEYLKPASSDDVYRKTLWHGDLHLDNVFVDAQTMKITHIIDWQSTTIMALFRQSFLPQMISSTTPQSQNTSSELPQDVNGSKEGDTGLASRYQEFSRLKNPLKWAAYRVPRIRLRTNPTELISGAWARRDMFSLRHAIITLIALWSEISQDVCPIQFEDDELESHDTEWELIEALGTIMHQLNDEGLLPLGGMAPREHYEKARALNEQFKQTFVDLGENEFQKDLYSKVWPYQDD